MTNPARTNDGAGVRAARKRIALRFAIRPRAIGKDDNLYYVK